jgi:mono/diheme cytochrome c family protein
MFNQPKSNPLRESDFFADGVASRPIPPHTIDRSAAVANDAFNTGMNGSNLVAVIPVPVTRELLVRGRERFEINCVPCHGEIGDGNGMVVQRGFPRPPSFHIGRLRDAPVGHFFDVMTRGYGVMYSQASHVATEDRWAIATYIRALQLSQHAKLDDLSPGEASQLRATR